MSKAIQFNIIGQPIETASFETLDRLYNMSNPIDSWFRQRYFQNKVLLHNQDMVPIGDIKTYVPIAPAVNHKSEGRVIRSKTQANVKYVRPAYLKPAEIVEPNSAIDEKIDKLLQKLDAISHRELGQSMTIDDQYQYAAVQSYFTLRQSIDARLSLMARDALLYGKVEVSGDDFETLEVDFGRHDDLLNYKPAIPWGQSGATPYKDQREMVRLLVLHGKKRPVDAVMSSAVFNSFVDDEEFNNKFTAHKDINATNVFNGTFGGEVEATLRGVVDGINYWTYDVTYDDENGNQVRMTDETGFWFISELQNYEYFCQIKHRKNPQRQAYEYFPYHVFDDDPPIDKFIMDSSPLHVPINKNGVIGGIGFIQLGSVASPKPKVLLDK